jgi:hypothetical protein
MMGQKETLTDTAEETTEIISDDEANDNAKPPPAKKFKLFVPNGTTVAKVSKVNTTSKVVNKAGATTSLNVTTAPQKVQHVLKKDSLTTLEIVRLPVTSTAEASAANSRSKAPTPTQSTNLDSKAAPTQSTFIPHSSKPRTLIKLNINPKKAINIAPNQAKQTDAKAASTQLLGTKNPGTLPGQSTTLRQYKGSKIVAVPKATGVVDQAKQSEKAEKAMPVKPMTTLTMQLRQTRSSTLKATECNNKKETGNITKLDNSKTDVALSRSSITVRDVPQTAQKTSETISPPRNTRAVKPPAQPSATKPPTIVSEPARIRVISEARLKRIMSPKKPTFDDMLNVLKNNSIRIISSTTVENQTVPTQKISKPVVIRKINPEQMQQEGIVQIIDETSDAVQFGCQHCGATLTEGSEWVKHGKELCVGRK